MRIDKMVIGMAVLAVLASCNQAAGGYPEKDKQAVITACKGTGAPAQVCECAMKKIEAKYTYAQFSEWNDALEQGRDHPFSAQAEVMTSECVEDYRKAGGQ